MGKTVEKAKKRRRKNHTQQFIWIFGIFEVERSMGPTIDFDWVRELFFDQWTFREVYIFCFLSNSQPYSYQMGKQERKKEEKNLQSSVDDLSRSTHFLKCVFLFLHLNLKFLFSHNFRLWDRAKKNAIKSTT